MVVSYGSRGAALADALYRSNQDYRIHIADKQDNPFNKYIAQKTGGGHVVFDGDSEMGIPALDANQIYDFAREIMEEGGLGFVFPGPEGPIIQGLTDMIEDNLNVPVLAPRKRYAIEASKADQRNLIQGVVPEANPSFYVAHGGPNESESIINSELLHAMQFVESLDFEVAIKPDRPGAGKGVVVYGDHFQTPKEAANLLRERLKEGDVVIEKKEEGEESSYMAFSDGNNLADVPDTRDYKRVFDGDKGPNTGGMGSYMDTNNWLPFLRPSDRKKEEEIIQKVFENMKTIGDYDPTDLKGLPFYVAFMHTRNGPKILEINSRPGDPEIMNVLPAMETDFGEVCQIMIDGDLKDIRMKPKASVLTYLVPPKYGGRNPGWRGHRKLRTKIIKEIMFYGGENLRVYPGSVERKRYGDVYMLGSRTLAVVGLGDTIEEARKRSTDACDEIQEDNPQLERRTDLASKEHIQKSIVHMKRLRRSTS